MQDLLNSKPYDEIDLRELFLTLWAYKFFISGVCALGIIWGGYSALNEVNKYSSTAIFKLDQQKSGPVSLGKELGLLASIAGVGSGNSDEIILKDQVTGRIFIEKLDIKLNFQADPYFNTYDPISVEPTWKSLIKRAIGWKKSPSDTKSLSDTQEAIWQGIISQYSKSIELDTTESGSIRIDVTHVNPQRAAEIANVIMNEIIFTSKVKKEVQQDEQLFYLSSTLANALNDLEVSQSKLKEFALENSALPLESFAAGSLQLDALREQLSRTSELHEAVAALSLMLQNKTTEQDNYLMLRQQFPIVDQVLFRRVLGQNEIISSWSWPKASSVEAVLDTLSERKNRLKSQISTVQIEAERSGLAFETFGKLEREAKIAEAAYTVLIEQVKAESMLAGYRPDRTEIFEYASIPINPSGSKRILFLALGAGLGLFIGALLSLILALRRGVYFSKKSIKVGAQARFSASLKTLLPLRNKSIDSINKMLTKKPRPALRDLAVEIHKSGATLLVVTSSRAKLSSIDVARSLGCYMQSETLKVAVIDFSSTNKKLDIDDEAFAVGSFVVAEQSDQLSVLKPGGELAVMELLGQKDFWGNIQSLNSTFDLVFLCADNNNAMSLLSAAEVQNTFHITLARTKNTKTSILTEMRSRLPIQGLLYD